MENKKISKLFDIVLFTNGLTSQITVSVSSSFLPEKIINQKTVIFDSLRIIRYHLGDTSFVHCDLTPKKVKITMKRIKEIRPSIYPHKAEYVYD
mgnify:CR=1 FL=1